MTQKKTPADKHTALFRSAFESGLTYDEYVATGDSSQQQRWQNYAEVIELTAAQRELLAGFKRTMNILVLSGVWCGDCMRQGPMFRVIEQAAPTLTFRYLDNQADEDVRDELRINGGARVPVLAALSEDFLELARLGDRTLSAYRRKAASELGPACDSGLVPPAKEELAAEVQDWVDQFERLHLILRLSPMLRERHGD